jgi:rod shape-determining protein MreD
LKEAIFILSLGAAVLVFQTTAVVFPVPMDYKPDLMLILIAWASLRMNLTGGICLSFLGGIVTDLFCGSPTGLFGLVYSLIFLAFAYLHATFTIERPLGPPVLVLGAAIAVGSVVLLARWLKGPVGFGWNVAGWILIKSVVTSATSLAVFPLIDWIFARYAKLVGLGSMGAGDGKTI